jgi:hypothetical protein
MNLYGCARSPYYNYHNAIAQHESVNVYPFKMQFCFVLQNIRLILICLTCHNATMSWWRKVGNSFDVESCTFTIEEFFNLLSFVTTIGDPGISPNVESQAGFHAACRNHSKT